jgi:hypothetical protein
MRGPPVIAQAAGLAVLAALSPTALLAAAVYLGSARPRQTTLFYLLGAMLMPRCRSSRRRGPTLS